MMLILGIFFPLLVSSIFEDQAGKFDWRKQLIGCPNDLFFDRVSTGSDRILVSTKDDILSSLSLNTGEIAWRRILEKRSDLSYTPIISTHDEDFIYSLCNEGRSLRVWRKANGVLNAEFAFDEFRSKIGDVVLFDGHIVVASSHKITAFSRNTEQVAVTAKLSSDTLLSKFVKTPEGQLLHVSAIKGANKIDVRNVVLTENIAIDRTIDFPLKIDLERCQFIGTNIACSHSDSLIVIDLLKSKVFEKNSGLSIRDISGSSSTFVVRGPSAVKLFTLKSGSLEEIPISISHASFSAMQKCQNSDNLVLVSNTKVHILSLENGKTVLEATLPEDQSRVSPRKVFASTVKDNEFELVLVGEDCRVEMIVIDGSKKTSLEWTREESLMRVASAEMVDLPLSESQQLIEDEFEGNDGIIITAFVRRILVQVGQLRRYVIRAVEQIFSISTTLSNRNGGIADFVNAIRTSSPGNSGSKDGPFERDYFNLRKVIIVSTLDGVVFGLDSNSGSVLWRIWLGHNFSPLKNSFGDKQVPIFVQRTTAHYQLNGLASVAFSDIYTSNGVIVSFNPIIGEVISKEELSSPIKRVSLLPFVGKTNIHPLIVFEKDNKITYVPNVEIDVLATAQPVHILDVDTDKKTTVGLKVDLVTKKQKKVWSGNLGLSANDEIIAIRGKPHNQKVHSQGRVLVDRNVQYKYVNPNLIAIASLDRTSQHLTIILLDSISGQIVHTATIGKASGPVHFVHSEHWLAYTYWSEKGRRTELGIIELYEEAEQSHKDVFDSMIPTKKPPIVMVQSYIYAQGVDAMSVSETEQGLTTRSILLALPCGNIHEVSKRLLDATRPLEVTPAMREEMIIGYMPEIPVATEEMINYNQTVHRVRGIKAAPSGLESTSLVLAYGTDLFFTRLTPSGTFDILKDDFDHVLITLVLAGLVIGTYVAKRFARSNALAAQWS